MYSIIYLGMNVHINIYSLCVINGVTGEILAETKCSADISMVLKFVENLKDVYGQDIQIKAGYEAGCLGYVPYHQLTKHGIDCDILAPTTMHRSSKNKLNKNDKLNARMIASNLKNKTYKAVYVLNDDDLAVKEYVCMLDDTKIVRKKLKQQINAFTLRYGMKYSGKSKWTLSHLKRLKKLELSPMLKEVLNERLLQYEALCDKIERYSEKLNELSHNESYEKQVSLLCCFKGIDTTAAMTLHIEISDFNRFSSAKKFSSYVGLTPGEDSSGDKTKYLSIMKQGNMAVRSTLIECAQSIVKGTVGKKSKAVKSRQKGQNGVVIAYADRAVERLQRKYHKMIYRGVNKNKAISAVARELACFVCGMEIGHIN